MSGLLPFLSMTRCLLLVRVFSTVLLPSLLFPSILFCCLLPLSLTLSDTHWRPQTGSGDTETGAPQLLVFNSRSGNVVLDTKLPGLAAALKTFDGMFLVWSVNWVWEMWGVCVCNCVLLVLIICLVVQRSRTALSRLIVLFCHAILFRSLTCHKQTRNLNNRNLNKNFKMQNWFPALVFSSWKWSRQNPKWLRAFEGLLHTFTNLPFPSSLCGIPLSTI